MDPRRLPCTFPPADKDTFDDADDRNIKVGDEVCVKQYTETGETIVAGKVVEVIPGDDGGVHHYRVKIARVGIRPISWTRVGIPRALSVGEKNPTATKVLFERNESGLPTDVENKIRGYGRKTIRKGRKARKARKSRRATRKAL